MTQKKPMTLSREAEIELAAAAIYDAYNLEYGLCDAPSWAQLGEHDKKGDRDSARAALSVLAQSPSHAGAAVGREEIIRAALESSITAIDDWLHLFAAEEICDDKDVAESRARVREHGTLWYIAEVQSKNREALALFAQAGAKREKS